MTVNRRGFLAAGAIAAAGAALAENIVAAEGPKSEPQAELKLSSQLGRIPGRDFAEKFAIMEKWGFDAVEPHSNVVGKEKEFLDALKNTKLRTSVICWGSHNGDMVSSDAARRAAGVEALRAALTSAGELGAIGVIYVPAFNKEQELDNREIRKILVDTLPALGEHAERHNTHVIMEPLNRNEAFFLRQVADAASIARDCISPGIAVMGDFYHMFIEEPSDMGAFISGGPLLRHVHLASRTRVLPGQDERSFVDGFRGLKWIGYRGYCSFECGVKGDAETEIPRSMEFLRRQWAEA
ncbi:MAG: sugar phosphate isomerase/epimerase [Pirellulaceae bacterium]|nr:sugar phosphate isomerase/epimerase [Pirellulaceae bacterium]